MCVWAPVVTGDDDVDAGARLADVLRLLVVHLPQRVCERAGGVDHNLGLHVKLLSWERGRMGCDNQIISLSHLWVSRSNNWSTQENHDIFRSCLTCDNVPAASSTHPLLAGLRVFCLQQVDDLGVVGDGGAVAGGSEANGQVHTGVVVLPWRRKEKKNCSVT